MARLLPMKRPLHAVVTEGKGRHSRSVAGERVSATVLALTQNDKTAQPIPRLLAQACFYASARCSGKPGCAATGDGTSRARPLRPQWHPRSHGRRTRGRNRPEPSFGVALGRAPPADRPTWGIAGWDLRLSNWAVDRLARSNAQRVLHETCAFALLQAVRETAQGG